MNTENIFESYAKILPNKNEIALTVHELNEDPLKFNARTNYTCKSDSVELTEYIINVNGK